MPGPLTPWRETPTPTPYSRGVPRTDGAAVPEDHVIVLFGALGDLARRKLLPGLFHLDRAGLMPERYKVIGTSRKGGSEADFRKVAKAAVGKAATGEEWDRFAEHLTFSAFNADDPGPLVQAIEKIDNELANPRRLFYLSVPPNAFGATVQALGDAGLDQNARVVLEKPFGVDLET